MELEHRAVSYTTTKSYSTLNRISSETEYAWIVFHGMGYLSRYFLKYFDGLDPARHFLVAPQAPSKYYLNGQFKHVGASWLTKEETALEMENILSYLDALIADIALPKHLKLIVFGYSQGVSIAMRWVVRRAVVCDHLILYAGGIPEELQSVDVEHITRNSQVKIIVGRQDEYITPERWEKQEQLINWLFKDNARIEIFEGQHEVRRDIINGLP